MSSGRKTDEEVKKAKKAIADIITYRKDKIRFIDGKPSPQGIVRTLKEQYNITVSRQFVSKTLDEGTYGKFVDTLCLEDNPKVIEIKDAMSVQQSIWNNDTASAKDRTMAANSWRALQKQLIEYENSLASLEIKKNEASRPIYLVKFVPTSVDVLCPKCGYSWFDIRNEKDKKADTKETKRVENEKKERGKEWKPFYNKEVKEQKTFDNFGNDEDEEFKDEFKKKDKKSSFQVVVENASE